MGGSLGNAGLEVRGETFNEGRGRLNWARAGRE